MDEEVIALLNAPVEEMGDNPGLDADGIDDERSVSVKSGTSSEVSDSDDISSSSVVDDDSADEYSKTCIRVGDPYQAFVSDKLTPYKLNKDDPREGVLLWKSCDSLSSEELTSYIQYAVDSYHFTIEQALGLLIFHRHDICSARKDLSQFEQCCETWSPDEISLFEEAYKIHNKRFHLYTELLPHKTMGSLVDYYYSRYKRRGCSWTPMNVRSSHAGAFSATAPAASSKGKNAAAEPAAKKEAKVFFDGATIKVYPSLINPTNPNPTPAYAQASAATTSSGSKSRAPFARPPRGLHLRLEELASLASLVATGKSVNPPSDPLDISRAELASSLSRLQQQRHRCSEYKRQLGNGISSFRQFAPQPVPPPVGQQNNSSILNNSQQNEPQWSKHETSLAVAAFRQYGANFGLIADFIGTKTESHVRYFYQTYRNRYNLDALLAEYEAERRNLNLFPTPEEEFLKKKQQHNLSSAAANRVNGNNFSNGSNNNNNNNVQSMEDIVGGGGGGGGVGGGRSAPTALV